MRFHFNIIKIFYAMCGLHKSHRGGTATPMLHKMLRCTGGIKHNSKITQKKILKIKKALKREIMCQKSLENNIGIIFSNILTSETYF